MKPTDRANLLGPNHIREAVISDCQLYRFRLLRRVPYAMRTTVLFCLNNPSVANATLDDPTVRRCYGFARFWGYTEIQIVNTNPYRSTDPDSAQMPPEDVLRTNDSYLSVAARDSDVVVAAWGTKANPVLAERALNVLRLWKNVYTLGLSATGTPKHPLYLPKETYLEKWKMRHDPLAT